MPTNDYNDANDTNTQTDAGEESGQISMPLGVGDLRDENVDPLAAAGSGRKIRSSSILLVAIVLLAVVGLFSMRFLARVTASGSANSDIEKTIDEFFKSWKGSGSLDGPDGQRLVVKRDNELTVIGGDYTDRQVALSDVQKNPFVETEATTINGAPDTGAGTTFEKRRALQQKAIESAAAELILKSVIMGSTPLANLDGRIVRLDETFRVEDKGVSFHVTEITPDSITLVSDVPDLELSVTSKLMMKKGP